MSAGDRKTQREQKLRDAICTADGITHADFRVFTILLWIADFGTANLPDSFQPKSLIRLAARCHMSERQVKYSLSHLERHGWLERKRDGAGGRDHRTRYRLEIGIDCNCKTGQPLPGQEGSDCTGNRAESHVITARQEPVSDGREAVTGKGVGWGTSGAGMHTRYEDSR